MERIGVTISAMILVAVFLVSLWLLIPACGVSGLLPWFSGKCDRHSAELIDKRAILDQEASALEAEIRQLERDAALKQCTPADRPEAVEPPKQEAELPPPPEPSNEVEQAAACTPEQKAVRASEIMMVFDTSRSMRDSIDVPTSLQKKEAELHQKVQRLENQVKAGNAFAAIGRAAAELELENVRTQIERAPGEPRISVARKIAIDSITKAPRDIDIGFVAFNDCSGQYHGTFDNDRRPDLVSRINNISTENPTALAAAVIEATRRLKGGREPDDFVNIVILTDGVDSCGGDPCAAARQAKQSRPGLVINVVDLSALNVAKCMADITGGFYKRRTEGMDLADLSRSMREASGYEGEGVCRN